MKKFPLVLFSLLTLLVAFSGCGPGSDGTGTLRVSLTDAPFPFNNVASATVTVTGLEARMKGDDESGFFSISEETHTADLTLLRNGVTFDLTSAELPAGDYDAFRVIVSGGHVVLTTGEEFELTVPSGDTSGIKVNVSPSIHVATSLTSDLLLDFDLARSFSPQGSQNSITGFHFKPVIRAANLTTAGTIAGLVSDGVDGIAGATVTVYSGNDVVTTTITDDFGSYKVIGLEAGTYDVDFEADGYQATSTVDLAVVAGNLTTADAALLLEGLAATRSATGSNAPVPTTEDDLHGAQEHVAHVHLRKGYSRPTFGNQSPLLTYGGGDVLNSHKTKAIFWGSQWNTASFAGDKITGIDQFFSNFNGSQYGSTSNEYYDVVGANHVFITSSSTYLGHVIDTSTVPTKALTVNSAVAEACKITGNSPDPTALYLIYTATDAGHVNYCAWHSWGTCSNGAKVQVAYMPNLDGIAGCDPQDTVTGHSQGLAAVINVTAHELMEAVSDPRGTGWTDSSGQENADKCAWTFAPVTASNPLGVSTLPDGSNWKLQLEWSNAAYNAGTGILNRSGQAACIF